MSRFMYWFRLAIVFLVSGMLAASAGAAERGSGSGTKASKKTTKSGSGKTSGDGTFSVVQIEEDYKIVTKSELEDLKKKAKADYKKEMDKYKGAAKAAQKEKQKFEDPKPVEQKIKVVKTGLKSKDEADAFLERLQGGQDDKGDKGGKAASDK